MNNIVKIYCEGKAGSSDFDIISKVIEGLPVIITPIGGKRGAKSAIQVHESGTSKSDFKLFFRDRDFDTPVPTSERLTNDDTYVYFSYRTTIENYLIDSNTINEYSKGKPWDSASLETIFINAARRIKYFQAMRHTLGKLRTPTDFGTNIVEKSGVLPNDLSKEFCQNQGYKKVEQSMVKMKGWTKGNFDLEFNRFVNLFSDEFISENQFLIFFQGKDYMKSFCTLVPNFSPKDYYNYAKANFDYTKFKDLVELRNLVSSKI